MSKTRDVSQGIAASATILKYSPVFFRVETGIKKGDPPMMQIPHKSITHNNLIIPYRTVVEQENKLTNCKIQRGNDEKVLANLDGYVGPIDRCMSSLMLEFPL